jgi:Fe2+ or Zn2+ uptake regulation protein/O6-methylguanine-DNA--protein-cysteine methyltransferase
MGKHAVMPFEPAEALRARGLRVTPQRRAILGAFTGTAVEHLSADEIHARASAAVPELGRGTVYATLAELTELGLLGAVGSPEPVRYETNVAPHHHFRCRVCLRLYDVELPAPTAESLSGQGFAVERVTVVAEGVCAECHDYEAGLRGGVHRAETEPSGLPDGTAAARVDTPLGTLMVGATPDGVVRVVWDNHADVPALTALMRSRRGGQAAKGHLAAARAVLEAYFAGETPTAQVAIDWARLDPATVETLRAVTDIRPGQDRSYDALGTSATARDRGEILGSNPVVILVSCHRVMRGREIPGAYVGGEDRRLALRRLERS